MSKITTAAVADKLSANPACDACIGFVVEVETEHNANQNEQRWPGTTIDRGFANRGVRERARGVLSWAAVMLRQGKRVRVYTINEHTYPETISSSCIVIDPSDFAK